MVTTATTITVNDLNVPATPNLIVAPLEYNAEHFNLLNNQLRLYFNQLNSFNKDLLSVSTSTGQLTGTSFDAFGRLRVGNPLTLFDSQNRYKIDNQFDTGLTGSATTTYLANESSVQLNVTTASGDQVIRETKRVFPYQPGKSLLMLATFVMDEGETNLRQRVGYFGANDGVFFQKDGSELSFVIRSSTSGSASDNRKVIQSAWNGDKLDGTGASGYTLDTTKAQILYMDFEWLGVGSVRCGFVINGEFIVCHTFYNANQPIANSVYMKTAILPIRYEITAKDTLSTARSMKQICSSVVSEGGYQAEGLRHMVGTANIATGQTVGTSLVNLVTIRLKSPNLDSVIIPAGADVLNISNSDFEYNLILNGTPSSAFTWNTYNDNVEYAVNAVTMTGGERIVGGYLAGKTAPVSLGSDGGFAWAYQLGRTISGVSDTITLAVKANSSSKAAAGLLKWYDLTD